MQSRLEMEERSKDSTSISRPRPLRREETTKVSTLRAMVVQDPLDQETSTVNGGNNGKLMVLTSSMLEMD